MTDTLQSRVALNNGQEMPWLGFGVYGLDDGRVVKESVLTALDVGYRKIDTATIYKNERGVGSAIRDCGIAREEIFLTTKLWNDDQRQERTMAAFNESLDRLGVEYVDLYLLHWPVADHFKSSWQQLEEIYQSGRARAIGVSNFLPHHLDDLLTDSDTVPAVNQVEFHPRLVQPGLLKYCKDKGIQVQAWSPLMQGHVTAEKAIVKMAETYQKTPAQIVLRWDLQHQVATIPKSKTKARILENTQIFDFELSADDMKLLDGLDEERHLGPDPESFDF